MASEAEDEYDYSDDEDYPVESDDDDEGMDWEESNPNAAPVIMGGGKGEFNRLLSCQPVVGFYGDYTGEIFLPRLHRLSHVSCLECYLVHYQV